MDPLDQSNAVESDPTAGPADTARERGLAPAGTLMSVQIRRRTLPREKVRQDKPAQEKLPEPTSAASLPEIPAAAATSDPGRRMQNVTSSPSPTPAAPPTMPIPTAPVAAPPAPAPPAPAPSAPPPAPELTKPAPSVREANTPSPQNVAPASPAQTPQAIRPEGIISYWLRLRGSRRFPAKADLDQGRIAADWPNSILMRCRVGSKALEPEKVFSSPATAPSAASGPNAQAAMDLSPMMLQWLLGLAGDAARDRRPMQDTEAFPSHNQSVQYGAFALPFSDDQAEIDHVLCHVYRMP